MTNLALHPHLDHVLGVWQALRETGDVPGISALTLDRLPETLRNVSISEVRGSEILLCYHGDDLGARVGRSLAGASYWDLLRDEDAPRWFTAIRLMLETPCGIAANIRTHTPETILEAQALALPFRAADREIRLFLSMFGPVSSRPAPPHAEADLPPIWMEVLAVEAIDIGFGKPPGPL